MFSKITLKPENYLVTYTIGNDEYLFDGDELLFKVNNSINDFDFYLYLLDKTSKPNIYINELLSLKPFEIL